MQAILHPRVSSTRYKNRRPPQPGLPSTIVTLHHQRKSLVAWTRTRKILLVIGDIGVVQNLWVAGQTHRTIKHGIPPELDHIDQRHKYQEYSSTYPY